MPVDTVSVSFTLTRGPANAPRSMQVDVPLDGTAVTLGRATDCACVMDPWFIFASQSQCSLFALSEKEKNKNDNGETTPVKSSSYSVFISDLCSSNGTFVNNRRIGGTEPVPLQTGDTCVLGGMRDVEVGEEIPADAYNGPELMVWRVDIADQPPAIPLEETPAVLPLREVLEKEEREVLRTVLRSVQKEEERRATSTSVMDTPRQKLFDGDALSPAGPPTVTKAPVATDASPAVPMRCHTPPPVEQTQPPKSLLEELTPEPRRSATIAAALSPRQVIPPPPPAHLLAVRLGKHTYHVPEERQQHYLKTAHEEDEDEEVVDQPARATKKGKRNRPVKAAQKTKKGLGKKQFKKEEPLAAPYQLQFTSSHWKWAMDNPNQQEKNKKEEEDAVFHCMLPTSSILSLMACEERRGLAVELKDGCSLPLIDASLLQGGDQNRWVVWLLEEEDNNTNSQDNSEASTYFSQLLRNLEVFYAQSKFCPPYCVEANIFDQIFAPSRQKVSS